MRTMLLPINGSVPDRWAMEVGLSVAAPFEAHLTTLLPCPIMASVPIYAYTSTAGYSPVLERELAEVDTVEAEARQLLKEVAAARGVRVSAQPDAAGPTVELACPSGDADVMIWRWAAVNDLIIYPRQSKSGHRSLDPPTLLKNMIGHVGRPVLIVTDEAPSRFDVVAIAWNGSTEGARAVTAAMPFLQRAERLVILTMGTAKTEANEAERLRGYLRRYGLDVEIDTGTPERAVGAELMGVAESHGADLLVSGCYTHGRIRQSLFGGVTHYLLENCRMPMLMAH